MTVPGAEEFYRELCRAGGCVAIACLHPSSWRREVCEEAWKQWQNSGNEGIFPYLDQKRDLLLSPFRYRPWAKSLLVFSFIPEEDPEHRLRLLPSPAPGRPTGWIAGYAMERDYHITGRNVCEKILASAAQFVSGEMQSEWGVDASPVWEKQAAIMAGIGRQGWNGLLYDEKYGSQIHLGTVFLSEDFPERIPVQTEAFCPRCGHCEHSCPGRALLGDGQLEVKNCLSWLSGEKHGSLSWDEQRHLQNHVFGCSVCTTGCPGIPRVLPPDYPVDAEEILLMSGRKLERIIHGTALQHMGATRLKRNCAAVLGCSLQPEERLEWRNRHLPQIGSAMIQETILNWPCVD